MSTNPIDKALGTDESSNIVFNPDRASQFTAPAAPSPDPFMGGQPGVSIPDVALPDQPATINVAPPTLPTTPPPPGSDTVTAPGAKPRPAFGDIDTASQFLPGDGLLYYGGTEFDLQSTLNRYDWTINQLGKDIDKQHEIEQKLNINPLQQDRTDPRLLRPNSIKDAWDWIKNTPWGQATELNRPITNPIDLLGRFWNNGMYLIGLPQNIMLGAVADANNMYDRLQKNLPSPARNILNAVRPNIPGLQILQPWFVRPNHEDVAVNGPNVSQALLGRNYQLFDDAGDTLGSGRDNTLGRAGAVLKTGRKPGSLAPGFTKPYGMGIPGVPWFRDPGFYAGVVTQGIIPDPSDLVAAPVLNWVGRNTIGRWWKSVKPAKLDLSIPGAEPSKAVPDVLSTIGIRPANEIPKPLQNELEKLRKILAVKPGTPKIEPSPVPNGPAINRTVGVTNLPLVSVLPKPRETTSFVKTPWLKSENFQYSPKIAVPEGIRVLSTVSAPGLSPESKTRAVIENLRIKNRSLHHDYWQGSYRDGVTTYTPKSSMLLPPGKGPDVVEQPPVPKAPDTSDALKEPELLADVKPDKAPDVSALLEPKAGPTGKITLKQMEQLAKDNGTSIIKASRFFAGASGYRIGGQLGYRTGIPVDNLQQAKAYLESVPQMDNMLRDLDTDSWRIWSHLKGKYNDGPTRASIAKLYLQQTPLDNPFMEDMRKVVQDYINNVEGARPLTPNMVKKIRQDAWRLPLNKAPEPEAGTTPQPKPEPTPVEQPAPKPEPPPTPPPAISTPEKSPPERAQLTIEDAQRIEPILQFLDKMDQIMGLDNAARGATRAEGPDLSNNIAPFVRQMLTDWSQGSNNIVRFMDNATRRKLDNILGDLLDYDDLFDQADNIMARQDLRDRINKFRQGLNDVQPFVRRVPGEEAPELPRVTPEEPSLSRQFDSAEDIIELFRDLNKPEFEGFLTHLMRKGTLNDMINDPARYSLADTPMGQIYGFTYQQTTPDSNIKFLSDVNILDTQFTNRYLDTPGVKDQLAENLLTLDEQLRVSGQYITARIAYGSASEKFQNMYTLGFRPARAEILNDIQSYKQMTLEEMLDAVAENDIESITFVYYPPGRRIDFTQLPDVEDRGRPTFYVDPKLYMNPDLSDMTEFLVSPKPGSTLPELPDLDMRTTEQRLSIAQNLGIDFEPEDIDDYVSPFGPLVPDGLPADKSVILPDSGVLISPGQWGEIDPILSMTKWREDALQYADKLAKPAKNVKRYVIEDLKQYMQSFMAFSDSSQALNMINLKLQNLRFNMAEALDNLERMPDIGRRTLIDPVDSPLFTGQVLPDAVVEELTNIPLDTIQGKALYHGTKVDLAYDDLYGGDFVAGGSRSTLGPGFYLTPDAKYATEYARTGATKNVPLADVPRQYLPNGAGALHEFTLDEFARFLPSDIPASVSEETLKNLYGIFWTQLSQAMGQAKNPTITAYKAWFTRTKPRDVAKMFDKAIEYLEKNNVFTEELALDFQRRVNVTLRGSGIDGVLNHNQIVMFDLSALKSVNLTPIKPASEINEAIARFNADSINAATHPNVGSALTDMYESGINVMATIEDMLKLRKTDAENLQADALNGVNTFLDNNTVRVEELFDELSTTLSNKAKELRQTYDNSFDLCDF